MKRLDIVNKLLKEGFSEKTLLGFSDKQLSNLSGMLFNEEATIVTKQGNMSPDEIDNAVKAGNNVKIQDVAEDKVKWANKSKKNKLPDLEQKSKGDKKPIKNVENQSKARKQQKGVHTGDIDESHGKDKEDLKRELADLKVKMSKEYKDKGKNVPQSLKDKEKEIMSAIKGEKKNKVDLDEAKKIAASKFWKQIKKEGIEKETVLEWVNDLTEKKYYSLTLKKEIMEMVDEKVKEFKTKSKVKKGHNGIPEFMTYDAITSGEAEPTTKPKEPVTKPGTRPRKTPYSPGPGINPKPKAMGNKSI